MLRWSVHPAGSSPSSPSSPSCSMASAVAFPICSLPLWHWAKNLRSGWKPSASRPHRPRVPSAPSRSESLAAQMVGSAPCHRQGRAGFLYPSMTCREMFVDIIAHLCHTYWNHTLLKKVEHWNHLIGIQKRHVFAPRQFQFPPPANELKLHRGL